MSKTTAPYEAHDGASSLHPAGSPANAAAPRSANTLAATCGSNSLNGWLLPRPAEAKLRGVQLQQQGDARMRELDYLQAYLRYQDSIGAAADRVEPHYRMGIALAGMKRFDKAVRELKLATDIDPTWVNSVSLDELLGGDNLIGKTQLKQRVADWASGRAGGFSVLRPGVPSEGVPAAEVSGLAVTVGY